MIRCVDVSDLRRWFEQAGFVLFRSVASQEIWVRPGTGVVVAVPPPNVFGGIPEELLADAFDAAGVPPPKLPVGWCD